MFTYLLLSGIVLTSYTTAATSQNEQPISQNVMEKSGGLLETLSKALGVGATEGRQLTGRQNNCQGSQDEQTIGSKITKMIRVMTNIKGGAKDSVSDIGGSLLDLGGLFSGVATLSGVVGSGVIVALGIAAAMIGLLPAVARSDPVLRTEQQHIFQDEHHRGQQQEFHNTHQQAQEHYEYYNQS